jgi:hypothetical protein
MAANHRIVRSSWLVFIYIGLLKHGVIVTRGATPALGNFEGRRVHIKAMNSPVGTDEARRK